MKLRTDYVTNSSSSSFILAKNPEMNEKQKAAILDYVERKFFGKKILTPESTEEQIAEVFADDWQYSDEDEQMKIRKALKEGRAVYEGYISYEACEYYYAAIFKEIWKIMEENGDGTFIEIDGDLSY